MMRLAGLFWLALVVACGLTMFKIKYVVQDLEDELGRVRRQTVAEQQELRVLNAEWSYLTQPDRLADLNRRFLTLGPIATRQLQRGIEEIPLRPPPPVPPPAAAPTPADDPLRYAIPEPAVAMAPAENPIVPVALTVASPAPPPAASPAPPPAASPAPPPAATPAPAPVAAILPPAVAAAPVRTAPATVPEPRPPVAKGGPSSLDELFAQIAEGR